MRPTGRGALSWLVVALGFCVGFLALASFGIAWVDFADRESGWLLGLLAVAGIGLLGLGFLLASIVAPRNRKRAGVIFLVFMPFTAFCLAYPESGFLVWHADGNGWFESPLPLTAVGLTLLFFAPLLSLFILRHRKLAAYWFAITVLLAGLVFGMSRWRSVLLPRLAGWSALFLLFGLFWLGTHKLGWPPLLRPRQRTTSGRMAAFAIKCAAVLCLDIVITLALAALGSSLFSPDCREKPPFDHPLFPEHAVFTTRVIFVGRSIEARTRHSDLWPEVPGRQVGDWAIGVVQERFWGLPPWPRLVLLTNYIYWKDETYFIDGGRGHGLLTRLLPIVEGGVPCSRTRPVADAIVDLRVLRERPSSGGARMIGYVRRPEPLVPGLAPPTPPRLVAGAKISVTGPMGTKTVKTDQSGVYQLDGLPPGDYTLQLLAPPGQVTGFFRGKEEPAKVHLDGQGLVEQSFRLFWNGQIEGHVVEEGSRKPAHARVMLINADRSRLPGYPDFASRTNDDGSFRITRIPPGRYTVVVNDSGPSDEGPYDIQYYPSALRAEDARVLTLSEAQQIKGIDFRVQSLTPRTIQLRVTWPNGSAVAGAHICVAYERTKDYESPACTRTSGTDTDPDGLTVIRLYGKSRARIYAEKFMDNPKKSWWDAYSSHPVESEIGKLPDKIDLVLTSQNP